jgi:hypothetical protein
MERPNILLATVQEVGDAAFALRHAGLCQPASGLYKALAFSLSAFCRSSRTKGVCYGLGVSLKAGATLSRDAPVEKGLS